MITYLELEDLDKLLDRRKGAQIVTISSQTIPTFVGGKSCPLNGRVTKVSKVNGMVNWNYTNSVNNQRMREESPQDKDGNIQGFVAEQRKWGTRLHNKPYVIHSKDGKGKVYLELKVERSLGHVYFLDGKELTEDEAKNQIHPHLRERKEGERQEVEKPVILRDYSLSNINQITLGGIIYNLEINPKQENDFYQKLLPETLKEAA